MSNEVSFSIEISNFKNAAEMLGVAETLTNIPFSKMITIKKIEDYDITLEASGVAPWKSSLNCIIELVEEKKLTMKYHVGDTLAGRVYDAEWRKGINILWQEKICENLLEDIIEQEKKEMNELPF